MTEKIFEESAKKEKKVPHIKDLMDMAKPTTHKDRELLTKAYHFAEMAHEGQLRNSGDPYFVHVFETAKNLANLGMDTKTIAAGLLHDTVEDTKVTEKELEKEFGEEIATLVKGVTKLGKVKYKGHDRHVESLRKFFIAASNDLRVLIIKLADRLHNVQTLEYVREDKRPRIALETIEIHAPLANRLGMGKLKGDLEDAAFPYAYPKEYKEIVDLLAERSSTKKKHLEEVNKILKKELGRHPEVHVDEINFRIKHKYSLWRKLQRYNMDIEKIYDISALRIVVDTIEECYRVLGIVHSLWRPLPGRIKDYIAIPKPNGYRSLHTTIFTGDGGIVEVQIRTKEMHAEAAYGVAAHFMYKEQEHKRKKSTQSGHLGGSKLEWVENLVGLQKMTEEPGKFIEHLKMDFFRDRIFIFTPKGDVVDLPEDSTPIDFAYAIHSNIGNHIYGAKVGSRFISLDEKLKNGDIVDVMVKKDCHPVAKWLEHTKTALAKKHIRSYMEKIARSPYSRKKS